MKSNFFESLVGLGVIFVAISFFFYAYSNSGKGNSSHTYEISAIFTEVSGLMTGADVRLSGIKLDPLLRKILMDKHTMQWSLCR